MAHYEYECRECRMKFDVKQSFAEYDRGPTPKCPKCGSAKVERLVAAIHVQTGKKS